MNNKIDLKQEEITKIWCYRDGELYRINNTGDLRKLREQKKEATYKYKVTFFKHKRFSVHRLIYILHYGDIPDGFVIDHIDHNPRNNRIENLRAVSFKDNLRNSNPCKNNKSSHFTGVSYKYVGTKIKGVTYRYKWYYAYINIDCKQICLGYFKTIDEAIAARKQANIKYGFHKNHGEVAL
jgi:hypothetical protein